MLGGQDENKGTLSSGEKYDPDTNSWSSLPPMNEASSLLNCWNLIFFFFFTLAKCSVALQNFILSLLSFAFYAFKTMLQIAFYLYLVVSHGSIMTAGSGKPGEQLAVKLNLRNSTPKQYA